MTETLFETEPETLWFYFDGWRLGTIVRIHSGTRITVKDCMGKRHRIKKRNNGKWVAMKQREF